LIYAKNLSQALRLPHPLFVGIEASNLAVNHW